MTDAGAKPGRGKWGKRFLIGALVVAVGLGAVAWYMTTDSFQAKVRGRVVAELERITGGRVEIGSIHTIPFRLLVDVRNLTIHGREPVGAAPYVHADRLVAHIKVQSVLGVGLGFESLVLERPMVHVILYPDGTSNQPEPEVQATSGSSVTKLVSLSIGHLEVRDRKSVV